MIKVEWSTIFFCFIDYESKTRRGFDGINWLQNIHLINITRSLFIQPSGRALCSTLNVLNYALSWFISLASEKVFFSLSIRR